MLVGQEEERTYLDSLIAAAGGGESAAFILYGEPGVGKTRQLECSVAMAADFRVLRARPLKAELELAFADLPGLLRLAPVPARPDSRLAGGRVVRYWR